MNDAQPQNPAQEPQQPIDPNISSEQLKPQISPKASFVIMIIVTLISLALSGYLAYQNYNLNQQIGQSQEASPSPTADPTADWETYTDKDGLYTIKVPPNWKVHNQWEQGINLPEDRISYTTISKNNDYIALTISKLFSHIPEYDCRPEGGNPRSLESINIGGFDTYDSFSFEGDDSNFEETTGYNYCINNNNAKYKFSFAPDGNNNNSEGIKIFYTILSTFKFLDQTDNITEDWETKTSSTCGVEMLLPPKQAPYYIPDNSDTPPAVDDEGSWWHFEERNLTNTIDKFFSSEAVASYYKPYALGSGYVAGNVQVMCGPNNNQYTSQTFLTDYSKQFDDGTFEGITLSQNGQMTLWGQQVTQVTMSGGMFNEDDKEYFFATPSKIYRIRKISMSSNKFIGDTTDQIFDSLQFSD